MSRYLPVETKNDWGFDTWRVGEVVLDGECPYVAMARWPDGTERRVWLLLRYEIVRVGDMGHDASVRTPVYYVRAKVHGVDVEIRATHLHINPASLRSIDLLRSREGRPKPAPRRAT